LLLLYPPVFGGGPVMPDVRFPYFDVLEFTV
jgi:hypothetical protein